MKYFIEIDDKDHKKINECILFLSQIINNKIGLRTIDDLELTERSLNCLKSECIDTLEDLLKKSKEELMEIPNFGRKSLIEVVEKLGKFGFSLRRN
jgi:DNA-directed RNA polymerase subunit alpha